VSDLPGAILSVTVSAYWSGVAGLALVNRWRHGRSAGFWPRKRVERLLWPVWVPLVVAWIVLPWLSLTRGGPWLGLPAVVRGHPVVGPLRLLAAAGAAGCLLLTAACWVSMGRNWSMAVVPGARTELVRKGLYALVRHPIYALSRALMLCTALVLPTPPMLAVAVLHWRFLAWKARSEEQFLLEAHGESYAHYCRQTGRFFPRLTVPR
jgi:protein-S-isoprenylcysteine O-methyltransferase Ste14